MITKDSSKLKKLVEFAEKGGIGTCVASQDISAKSEADLMFYTGEVITVLKHIKDDIYLGYCEGVIGTFKGKTVKFNGSLKNPKSMKSEKNISPPSQSSSSENNYDQSSPKKSNSIQSSDSVDKNLGFLENKSQSQPIINIIPDPSEDVKIIIPSRRSSSIASGRSTPVSPRKLNTMPQLQSNPEPIIPQRRNNTVPIISISHEEVNSNQQNDQIINANPKNLPPQQSPVNSQNQIKYSDPSFSRNNDQIVTRERQNSTSAVPDNRQNNLQNSPIGRPRGRSMVNEPKGRQIPGISNASVPRRIETSNLQRNEHRRSRSIPNINRSYDSPSSSPISSPKSLYNKRHSQTFDSPTSITPNPFQYKPRDQAFNETFTVNGKSIPLSLQPRSSPGMKQSYNGYPNKVNGQNSQKYSMGINKGINQKSVIGHYSPSTTPLPSPKMPQIKVLQEENVVLNNQDSPSTTPLPSPRFAPRNIPNNNLNYEGRVTAANTPAPTPVIITPKITIEDSDLDDSDLDQEESLISYRSFQAPTLRVDYFRSDTPDTPSEQLSANESEDIKDIPPGADRIQRIIQAPGAEEKTTRTIRLYREREAKWVALLGSMDPVLSRDSRKIKKLVRSGIPESVRGKAWQFMACADRYRKPGVFDDLRNRERLPIYDDIERDINRCYPDHIHFLGESSFGQDDLHNVLKAYAHYNQAVGYCQGMGRLVGMMLMQMPAEDSFWLLVATIEEYMVGYFTPTLSQVKIDSIVFEKLLFEHDSRLAQHLASNGVVPIMYMTQWFMTIFTMALPWASVLRVWDIFYFEGVKLFFRIGLAILDCTKEHLLKNCPTNAELLGFLLHIPHELLTPDLLLETAFKIRLKRSAIRRLTKRANAMEKNNEGSDASATAAGSIRETRRGLMKKSKSVDKLKIDGIEFKLVGE
ncbi:9396_t:CDS:10 [Rhizophagus irregularis]|nr:9396_t:CDS:10 [Rhizophagus irregularis]